jgi:glucosamine--fructose-6-phosphate aminotransferase (isomerizing)
MVSDTLLFQEIHQQPSAIQHILDVALPQVNDLAKAIREREVTHVVIAARGTSDNAGIYAKYLLGAVNGLTVALAAPSLFSLYNQPPRFNNALVIGISQSGKSPDIISVLAEARRQGALTAVITNTPGSPLALLGDVVVSLEAGEERSVAATKTYTTSLAVIAMLSISLAADDAYDAALNAIPRAMTATLAMNESIAQIAPRYRYMSRCVVIGRGYNYATALEIALKMKELTYTIVEPYSSADFLHGPMALLEPGFPVIVIAPSGVLDATLAEFVAGLNERQAETIVISDLPSILELARIPLALPQSVPEWLSPLVTILPGQLLSLHLAATRGYDLDSPRGLLKVTETR